MHAMYSVNIPQLRGILASRDQISGRETGRTPHWDAAGLYSMRVGLLSYSLAASEPSLKPSTMPPNSTGGTSGAAERGVPVKVNGCSEPGSATSTTTISPGFSSANKIFSASRSSTSR